MSRLRLPPKRGDFPCPAVRTDSLQAQYMPQLADYPGDPKAVVTSRAQLRRIAAEKKLRIRAPSGGPADCECDYLESAPPEKYVVAEDIVEQEVDRLIDRDHGGSKKNVPKKKLKDMADAARERLSGTQD